MKVLQLIDSLRTGGAERVAVNISNSLVSKIDSSFLCTTRKEGALKSSLDSEVQYLFLNKKNSLDILALLKLLQYVKKNKIDIIHAHSTSFLFATLIKLLYPKVKIIWHDHYGKSEFLKQRKANLLKLCSKFFSTIISVNGNLKQWSQSNLYCKNVIYLPNFAVKQNTIGDTSLFGVDGKRILNLANLRPQKDHFTLFLAFKLVLKQCPDWTLHCVGWDFGDKYAAELREYLKKQDLEETVFLYGSRNDVGNIIEQSNICVLSSKSEGLPIALLEYGLHAKPVVVTRVGDCVEVVEHKFNGMLVAKENKNELAKALIQLIKNEGLAKTLGENLRQEVEKNYSKEKYINKLIAIYKMLK